MQLSASYERGRTVEAKEVSSGDEVVRVLHGSRREEVIELSINVDNFF